MSGDRNGAETSDESSGGGERDVTATDLFEMLADSSRRRILRRLRETDGPICVRELADQLVDAYAARAADESAEEVPDGSSDAPGGSRPEVGECDPERVAVRLHHSHLPKLDEYGLVDYDPESHTVVAEIPAWVEPYLDVVED